MGAPAQRSKSADLIARLKALGHQATVDDPPADAAEAKHEMGLDLDADALDHCYDALVAAAPHDCYRECDGSRLGAMLKPGGLVADLKGMWRGKALAEGVRYRTV